MRISIFANEIPSTVFIENMVKGLAERGHNIFLYGKCIQNPHYEDYKNINIISEPNSKISKVYFALKYCFKLLVINPKLLFHIYKLSKDKKKHRWMRKFNMYITLYHWNLDIIHIQWAKSISWLEALIKDGRINTVLSLRGTHINVTPLSDPKTKINFEVLFPSIKGFHSVSYAMIDEAKKYDMSLPNRSVVAYPAITPTTYNLFTKEYTKTEQFNIISIGRDHWIKGYTYALDALRILVDEGVPAYYTIVASGTLPDQLLFQIEDLDLYKYVNIINGLPHTEVLKAVSKADVLLMSSIEEGVPNVVLEAMAVGTPVVSTDCRGIPEIIDDGITGYITQACFPDSIASDLKKVYIQSADEREQMILKAREKLTKNHLLEIQLDNIEKLYLNVINNWK